MAFKGNTKPPTRVSLPRRSKRQLKLRTAQILNRYVHRRTAKNITHVTNLPDEVLLKIFSCFSATELFYTIRPVCKRWMALAMAPTLWREIHVETQVPTDVLRYWIKSAKLLKSFTMKNRNDTNLITEELSKNCKQLESIKVQNCWGTTKNCLIHSTPLCNLVSRCSKLYNFNFSQSRFTSRKFFRLISKDKRRGNIMKKLNYIGPMTRKQLKALFAALRDYEVHDTATIGNANLTEKYKLRDMIKYFQEMQNPRQIVNEVWEPLNYGNEVMDVQPLDADI